MKNAIILGFIFFLTLVGTASAQGVFPIYCPTANWTGQGISCSCPTNTYMTAITFTMNGDLREFHSTLWCAALTNIKTTGKPNNGNEVSWPNTGQIATAQCGQNNLMTGFSLTDVGSSLSFTPYCTPVDGLTGTQENGNRTATHNTGDPGTSRCPTGSLAKGLWGANNYSTVFHFEIQCWKEKAY